jgi:hypothetical protein
VSANLPEERSEIARLGAYASWAATPDRAHRTAPARAAALARRDQLRQEARRREEETRARLSALQAHRRLAEATEAVAAADEQLRSLGLVAE